MDEQSGGPGLAVRVSPYSVAQTVDRLKQALARASVTLFAQIDHAENAARRGLARGPARLEI